MIERVRYAELATMVWSDRDDIIPFLYTAS